MLVFACVLVALTTAALDGFRIATVLIAATFVLASGLRLCLRDVGVLAVRSRFTDIAVLLFFGLGVLILGLSIPEPVIELPWVPKRTG